MISFKPCDLPVITGDKVTLRPITDADTDLIVRWRNDPAVQQFFIFREPFTPEMHQRLRRERSSSISLSITLTARASAACISGI